MTPAQINAIGASLESLRDPNELSTLVSIAANAPTIETIDPYFSATVTQNVRGETLSASSAAMCLSDAIGMARAAMRELIVSKERQAEKEKAERTALKLAKGE